MKQRPLRIQKPYEPSWHHKASPKKISRYASSHQKPGLKTPLALLHTATRTQIRHLFYLHRENPRSIFPCRNAVYGVKPPVDLKELKWGDREGWWREIEREDRQSVLVDTSMVKNEVFRLGDLPPELRLLICQFADLEWRTRRPPLTRGEWVPREMPPFIVAMRGWRKRHVYFEASKLFYGRNAYVLRAILLGYIRIYKLPARTPFKTQYLYRKYLTSPYLSVLSPMTENFGNSSPKTPSPLVRTWCSTPQRLAKNLSKAVDTRYYLRSTPSI
jgi:hypothetical protein